MKKCSQLTQAHKDKTLYNFNESSKIMKRFAHRSPIFFDLNFYWRIWHHKVPYYPFSRMLLCLFFRRAVHSINNRKILKATRCLTRGLLFVSQTEKIEKQSVLLF
uniref:Uncharacterized protein n=1 Tax=Heterorhabditis bacteriophora TaxID=37862 RepID=A0A1I7WI00_HETBA